MVQNVTEYFVKKFKRKYFAGLAAVMLLVICAALLQTIVLPDLLGRSLAAIQKGGLQTLSRILLFILGLSIILGIVLLLRRLSMCYLQQELDCLLQKNFIMQLWYDKTYYKRNKEELPVLFRDTVPAFSNQWVEYVTGVVGTVVIIVVGSVYSICQSPILYAICILLTILTLMVLHKRKRRLEEEQEAFTLTLNEENKKSWEYVRNHEVEGFLNPDKLMKGYRQTSNILLKRIFSLKKTGNAFQAFTLFSSLILMLCIAGIGGSMVLAQQMQMAALYQMLFVLPGISRQIFYILELSSQHSVLQGMYGILDKSFDVLKEQENTHDIMLQEIHEICVSDISFGYTDQAELFEKFSCRFCAGEYWALTGKEGCGKSTFLKLLAGIIPYTKGKMMADNIVLSESNRHFWWNSISYLDQTPRHIYGTIRDNIVMNEKMDNKRLESAVYEADLADLISKLADGLDAQVEHLSSGEKQKVCFARAFYRNRKILLLDEATSALDVESEKRICSVLKKKTDEGWLVVGISHRKQFTEFADNVIHFENCRMAILGETVS